MPVVAGPSKSGGEAQLVVGVGAQAAHHHQVLAALLLLAQWHCTGGTGGALSLTAGTGASGIGGAMQLAAGQALTGGAMTINAGVGTRAAGGSVSIAAGAGSTTVGSVAMLSVAGSYWHSSSTSGTGASVSLTVGTSDIDSPVLTIAQAGWFVARDARTLSAGTGTSGTNAAVSMEWTNWSASSAVAAAGGRAAPC
eukprot:3178-Heterococcus_DN1.PRE.2